MIYDSILGTIGKTPIVRINRLAPKNVTMYVKCEFFNPLSSVKDRLAIAHYRGRRKVPEAQTRADGRRGDLRQYRHRARHGVRGQGLSVRRGHDGDLFRRAPQDHAHARRQGDPHPGRRARHRHGERRRRSSPESTAGSSPASSRTRPTLPTTATPPGPRSCSTSSAGASTTSSPAGARAARSPASGEMIRLARPEVKIIATEPAGGRASGRQALAAAQDPGLDARTSCPRC